MSVYQVEEYYVFVSWDAEQKLNHAEDVKAILDEKFIDSYELSQEGVTVDGFDCENAAGEISQEIESIINS